METRPWWSRFALVAATVSGIGGCVSPAETDLEGESFSPLRIPEAYDLVDLGALGGDTFSYPTDVNNRGQVVGTSRTNYGYGASRGFFWTERAGIRDLGSMPDYEHVYPGHLNERGEIAGTLGSYAMEARGFVWRGGEFALIEPPPGATTTAAYGINRAGDVVGGADFAGDGNLHAFLRDAGGDLTELGVLPGGTYSFAYDINRSDDCVGYAEKSPGEYVGALWMDGEMIDLSTVLSVPDFVPYAIARGGEMAGYSHELSRAIFVDDDLEAVDLRSLEGDAGSSSANDVNRSEQVVGASSAPGSSHGYRAFLWEDGEMVDLNALIPEDAGMELLEASAINDRGQIVGVGALSSGEYHAFRLTPILQQ